jgi:Beta-galactosidase/beta-glucuronidase
MKNSTLLLIIILSCYLGAVSVQGQTAMNNVYARHNTSLNGKWNAIVDPTGVGNWREVWKERKPEKKTDFFEYSFDGGPILNVPGDFNTQMAELTYVEGTVWYKKVFDYSRKSGKRVFLHFGAVNYMAGVYLNGNLIGNHEGGFTPFQFEITDLVKEGQNVIVVNANNQRLKDGIPGTGYDWFNYGGITRDVNLVETPSTYIRDYSIQLKKHSENEVLGWVKLDGAKSAQNVKVSIPELKVSYTSKSDENGYAPVDFKSKFELWSSSNPKLYKVIVQSETDTVVDEIGFRNIEVKGPKILLNGKQVFLKGVNIHEENPLRAARAFSESDALTLLTWAKDLGCNFIRLAHYPHSEYMVKLAERMGLMVWSEIPVYQSIDFESKKMDQKLDVMLQEMITRDRNRCGIVIWSISNETWSSQARNNSLIKLSQQCRKLDSTRLVSSAFCNQGYNHNTITIWDTINRYFDVVAINEYLGWYVPWQGAPRETRWEVVARDKPVLISEFGGESLFGNNSGPKDEAASWSEYYQEQIYKDQIDMFKVTPNLCGVCPWVLADFRSMGRMHPKYQNGWNRKGLLSDRGDKKRAWYVLKRFYDEMK